MVKKKAVRAKPRTKRAAGKKATRQGFHKRIRKHFQDKVDEALKLQRRLEGQNLHPDEVASRVREKLDELSDGISADMLRYMARGGIFN